MEVIDEGRGVGRGGGGRRERKIRMQKERGRKNGGRKGVQGAGLGSPFWVEQKLTNPNYSMKYQVLFILYHSL